MSLRCQPAVTNSIPQTQGQLRGFRGFVALEYRGRWKATELIWLTCSPFDPFSVALVSSLLESFFGLSDSRGRHDVHPIALIAGPLWVPAQLA